MLRITLLGLWARRRRLARLMTAVSLGVAFLTGTFVLGDTLRHSYATSFADAQASVGVVVKSQTSFPDTFGLPAPTMLLDGTLAGRIAALNGVAGVRPVIQGYAAIQGAGGKILGGRGSAPAGGNWITDRALSGYQLTSGRPPAAPDEIVINQSAATDGHLHVGDHLTVDVPQPVAVTVAGIAAFGGGQDIGDTTYAAFTLQAARQHFTAGRDLVSALLVKAAPGLPDDVLARHIQPVLPAGIQAVTGLQDARQRAAQLGGGLAGSLQAFLFVFAAIALVVAVSSVSSTFSIVFAQRTRELGLLQAIGATRRQVLAAALGESLLAGVVASLAGLAVGIGLGAGLRAMFGGFGFSLPAGAIVITPRTLVAGFAAGVAVSLAAGAAPALRASRVVPLAALREGIAARAVGSLRAALTGAVILAAGVGLGIAGARSSAGSAMTLACLGALLTLAGALAVASRLAGPAASALGRPVQAWRGIPGLLARRNAAGDPRRTASTAAALTIGVTVVAFFAVLGASLGSSIDRSLHRSLRAGLVVVPASDGGTLSPRLAGQIAAIPGVAASVGLGPGALTLDGHAFQATVADAAALNRVLDLHLVGGTLGGGQLSVSATQARRRHWQVGSILHARFPDGSAGTLRIGAVYTDTTIAGSVLVNRGAWTPHSPQDLDTAVFVKAAAGISPAALHHAVQRAATGQGPAKAETAAAYGSDQKQAVQVFLGLVYAVLTLAVLIALMTIANAVSLAVHERTRELGLLRAVGQTRAQLRSMIRWDATIVAAFGCLLGLAVGTFTGWSVVRAAAGAGKSLGPVAITAVTVPAAQLVIVLVAGTAAGVLAARRPARRAARLDMLAAITTE